MKIKNTTLLIGLYFLNMIFFTNGSLISKACKVLFVTFTGMYILLKKGRFKWYGHFWWLVICTSLASASINWAESKEYAISGTGTIALNSLCIIFLGILFLNDKEWKSKAFPMIVIMPSFLFLKMLLMHGLAVFGGLRYIEGGMHNTIGMYAGIGASFAICFLKITSGRSRDKWWMLLVINTLICIVSVSRKAMLYLFLPTLFTLLFSGKKISKKVRNAGIILATAIIAYISVMKIPILYEYVGKGIESAINYMSMGFGDASAAGRNTRIRYGQLLFADRPWLGYGTMNFNYKFHNFESITEMIVADNNFIDTAVNFGILGLVIYYSIYVRYTFMYIKCCRHRFFQDAFPFALLLTLLAADYGVSSYLYLHSQTFLMIATMMIFLNSKETEKVGIKNERG